MVATIVVQVPGNFHLSTHAAQEQPNDPDMNHIIHELIFGERVTQVSDPDTVSLL